MLTEQVKVISLHGEKLNKHYPNVGHALPLAIDEDCSTIIFECLSDGTRFNRHVSHEDRAEYQVGQILTQVIS